MDALGTALASPMEEVQLSMSEPLLQAGTVRWTFARMPDTS